MRLVASIPSRTAVRGLGDDRRVGLVLEDLPQADADERLVVGQEDGRHTIGSFARTANPPPGRRLASKRPP